MVKFSGALSYTNPLALLKTGANYAAGRPLQSLGPASGGAINAYYGRQGMAGGVNKATRAPATQMEASNLLASGATPQSWWANTPTTQGNLYANGLQNEYVLPSAALQGNTFGYAVNPNVTDPTLRSALQGYVGTLNPQLRTARDTALLMGGNVNGPLGTFSLGDSGYQQLQQANPDKLPQFTDANQFGEYMASRYDPYMNLMAENAKAGVQGVGINSPGMEKLKTSNPTLYAKNEAMSVKSPDYTRQIIRDATAQRQSIAAPGEKTAMDELASWQPKWLQSAGNLK